MDFKDIMVFSKQTTFKKSMEHRYIAECPEVVSLLWAEARGGFVIVQSFVVFS